MICVAGVACKKDGAGTAPVISFASYDPNAYFMADSVNTAALNVTFNISDSDGDIEDTISLRAHYKSFDDNVWLVRMMPDIGSNKGHSVKGQVTVALGAIDLTNINENSLKDSIWFSAFVVDNAGHHSDTVLTPKIPIIK
ncbi:hypothetical protein DCM91_08375 [Chitinophaga costaii]|nr:hypothetical protein DCM91_08375 [Chitinophaga costaii]